MTAEREFYIHDTTRGYVGNCMVWWRRGHCGYTCDVNDAHVFTEGELAGYLEAGDLVAYPVEYIRSITRMHVDMQHLNPTKGVAS